MKNPRGLPHSAPWKLAFVASLFTVFLLTQGCTSAPGSASQYQDPFRTYVGPGYGGGPIDADGYSSGLPSVAGSDTASWYDNTRP